MDADEYSCVCGRSFAQASGLNYHNRTCKKARTRLSGALEKAKEVWAIRKKRRLENTKANPNVPNTDVHSGPSSTDAEVHYPADLFFTRINLISLSSLIAYQQTMLCCNTHPLQPK
jgi:hypothetical protein